MMKIKFGDNGAIVETLAAARGCRKNSEETQSISRKYR
jgi:hypothetical protein